jgi:tetratricopeptide (TPR) repeat protein
MNPSIVQKYERILQADPRSRIFVELARALLEAGDAQRAAEVCERGLEHHPDSVQARVAWGKALLALGRTDEALARLEEAIAADPANPYGYSVVGEALVRNGLADRALPLMEKGVALHPGDGRIRRWLVEARRAATPQAEAAAPRPENEAPSTETESSTESSTESESKIRGEPPSVTATPSTASAEPSLSLDPDPGWDERCQGSIPTPSDPLSLLSPFPPEEEMTPPDAAPTSIQQALPPTTRPPHVVKGAPQWQGGEGGTPQRQGVPEGVTSQDIPASRLTPPPLRSAVRSPPAPRRADPEDRKATAAGSVLDLIPDAPAAPREADRAGASGPASGALEESPAARDAESEAEAEAAARTYEHELREKLLAEPPPRPSFLRRHALAAALVAIALAIAAGGAIFVAVRASRRADEARAAVEAARKGLARDTVGALREAARVLAGARRAAPENPDAAALEAEVSGLLAHDFGDADARGTARELLARGRAGGGALAASWLVAEPGEQGAATEALLDRAAEGTPLARALAGEILLARRDRDGARYQLEAAARSSPPLLRALSALGDLDLARGNVEAALDRYALVLRAHPTHPRATLGAAEARLRLGRDLPAALRELEAVDADPKSAPPIGDRLRMDLLLARLLAASGRTADAERRLGEAAAREPARAEIAAAQAEVFAYTGELDRALRSAEGAARLAPADASYRELLARLQLRRGRYRELLAASETAPSRALRLYRGIARFELGQPEQARTELEGTRRDGKMPAEAAGWMALAELAAGRRARAAAIVTALLAVASPHPLALLARGRLDLAEGRPDMAEQRFREAAERDPDLLEARCDLGRALLKRGRAAEAGAVLEKAVARNPYFLDARLELGHVRLATGDAAGAVREFDTVVAERTHDVPALLALSSAHLRTGNPVQARRAAERALASAPRSAAAALAAGKAAAAQGATGDARRFLERAAKLGGKAPEAAEARHALASLKRR